MLLHQYLQKIPVDRFTRLTPAWSVREARRDPNQVFLIVFCSLGSDNVVSVKSIFFSWASDFLPRYVLQASLKLQCPWPSNPQN